MKKTSIAAAAATLGLLLAACGGLHTATTSTAPAVGTADVITMLERACLDDPTDAAHWARLAAALDADGQRTRATRFYQQAATLSAHDARRDYAVLAAAAVAPAVTPAPVAPAAAGAAAGVDATLPRTQVRQVGAAMVQVVRVPAATATATVVASAPATAPSAVTLADADPVRLEISNGNGITGAAARLARTLDVDGLKTTRLTNVKHFNVPLTRIEYPHAQQRMAETLSHRLGVPLRVRRETAARTDLRLVLGHDAAERRLQ